MSKRNFYEVLGVPKDASDDDLKKAYRKLALRFHPDKAAADDKKQQEEYKQKFQQISHAYEVLSNKEKRAVYDRYGEEGINASGPDGSGGFSASGGRGGGAGGMPFHDPAEIFAQFFGTSNPFSVFGMGGDSDDDAGVGRGGPGGGLPGGFKVFMGGMGPGGPMGGAGGGGAAGGMPFGMGMGMGGMPGGPSMRGGRGAQPMQPEPIKRQLLCSLEELYTGATKRVKVTRKRLNPDGKTTRPEEKVLEIHIKPGWKKGTTVTFEREGDEEPGVVPPDIQFVIGEKEHDKFSRDGNDLVHKVRLPLADALGGTTLTIPTLDGRSLPVPITEVVSPSTTKTIRGEGMPVSKTPGSKGDLKISFDIVFPRSLSDDKKRQLKALLAGTS